jgi:N-acetylglucosamine-6-phosphate deacetylase
MTTLVNARLGTPTPLDGWLQIESGVITGFGPGEPPRVDEIVDVAGRWVLPGFVDTHCHGGGGAALYSGNPDDVLQAARTHLRHGTTTLIASIATMRLDRMLAAAAAIAEAAAPNIRGIHFEGPFLSPHRRGAQTGSALLIPDEQVFTQLIDATQGLAVSMTIAPELREPFIRVPRRSLVGVVGRAGSRAWVRALMTALRSAFCGIGPWRDG